MGRKIRITEEQYNSFLKEGVLPNQKFTVQANTNGNPIDAAKNVEQTKKNLEKTVGTNLANKNFNVATTNPNAQDTQIVSKDTTNTNGTVSVFENKILTKKELQESRLKELKKNSKVYTLKDFINNFPK